MCARELTCTEAYPAALMYAARTPGRCGYDTRNNEKLGAHGRRRENADVVRVIRASRCLPLFVWREARQMRVRLSEDKGDIEQPKAAIYF